MKNGNALTLLLVGIILFLIWKLYQKTIVLEAQLQPVVNKPTTNSIVPVSQEANVDYADYFDSLIEK